MTLEPPRLPSVDPNTGSVRSLSAFPPPPTHFPLPPPRQQPQHSPISQSAHSSNSNVNLPPQSIDLPVSANDDQPRFSNVGESDQTHHQQYTRDNSGSLSPERTPERPRMQGRESNYMLPATTSEPNDLRQPIVTQPQTTMPTNIRQKAEAFENPLLFGTRHGSSSSGDTRPSNTRPHSQDDYQDNGHEFGMNYRAERPMNSRTIDNSNSPLERTDSLVAAMRNRFSNAVRHFCFLLL